MRRITTWLAVTLAVVGMAGYYHLSLSGDGKQDTRPVSAACQSEQAPRADATPAPGGAEAEGQGDKAGDLCAQSEHTGKPGENKDE